MNVSLTTSHTDPGPADWVPVDSCTLPTADQPLRVADFDTLFAAALRAVERSAATPTQARLVLAGDEALATRVQQLADAETSCCSFFTFTITPLDPGQAGIPEPAVIALDVAVPPARSEVLTALVRRATDVRQARHEHSSARARQ